MITPFHYFYCLLGSFIQSICMYLYFCIISPEQQCTIFLPLNPPRCTDTPATVRDSETEAGCSDYDGQLMACTDCIVTKWTPAVVLRSLGLHTTNVIQPIKVRTM